MRTPKAILSRILYQKSDGRLKIALPKGRLETNETRNDGDVYPKGIASELASSGGLLNCMIWRLEVSMINDSL